MYHKNAAIVIVEEGLNLKVSPLYNVHCVWLFVRDSPNAAHSLSFFSYDYDICTHSRNPTRPFRSFGSNVSPRPSFSVSCLSGFH